MTPPTPLRSELVFASLLAYSPTGSTDPSTQSRRAVLGLKENKIVRATGEPVSEYLARRLREEHDAGRLPKDFDGVLPPNAVLVPTPRSSRRMGDQLWPALEIANALRARGFGSRVESLLVRTTAVPKSAWSRQGERPSARTHFASLSCASSLAPDKHYVLIDDVVTKGATLLGAATRLAIAFPSASITAFVAARTLGLVPEIPRVLDPCIGRIEARGDEAVRTP